MKKPKKKSNYRVIYKKGGSNRCKKVCKEEKII